VVKLSRNERLLYRSNKQTLIHVGHTEATGVYEKFYSELNKKDLLYQFPVAGILGMTQKPQVVFPNKNKNVLSFPDIQVNKIFKDIVGAVKESCNKFNLSYDTNRYYLSCDLLESPPTDFWHDQSSASKPALFGILCLGDSISNIKINEAPLALSLGDIVISEAGNKIVYLDSFKYLSIQVLPVSELKGQYLEKWIPLC
jgi:hypothetical protein